MNRSFVIVALVLSALACGASRDDYVYSDLDPGTMDVDYVPGMASAQSPYESNEWNCGLRAVSLIRAGIDSPWDPVGLEHYVAEELPLRSWGVDEGMGTAEVNATAQRAGFRTRVNINTAFEDIWEGIEDGYPAALLTQDGVRDDGYTHNKILHWVPVVGIAAASTGERYLIVVPTASGKRRLLPKADFRQLVWWSMDGFSGAAVEGAGIRPGTSIRLDLRTLRAQEQEGI